METTSRTTGDARTRRNQGAAARAPRGATDDVLERGSDELLSDEEYKDLIRSEFVQEALPKLKPPPNWHYCWLSTMAQQDPIHKRMRLGYQPVTFAELLESGQDAGLESYKVPSGEFANCVSCNEMVLFKIPQRRYQMIMAEFHHDRPLAEEEQIRSRAVEMQRDQKGRTSVEFDEEDNGMRRMGDPVPRPVFS